MKLRGDMGIKGIIATFSLITLLGIGLAEIEAAGYRVETLDELTKTPIAWYEGGEEYVINAPVVILETPNYTLEISGGNPPFLVRAFDVATRFGGTLKITWKVKVTKGEITKDNPAVVDLYVKSPGAIAYKACELAGDTKEISKPECRCPKDKRTFGSGRWSRTVAILYNLKEGDYVLIKHLVIIPDPEARSVPFRGAEWAPMKSINNLKPWNYVKEGSWGAFLYVYAGGYSCADLYPCDTGRKYPGDRPEYWKDENRVRQYLSPEWYLCTKAGKECSKYGWEVALPTRVVSAKCGKYIGGKAVYPAFSVKKAGGYRVEAVLVNITTSAVALLAGIIGTLIALGRLRIL